MFGLHMADVNINHGGMILIGHQIGGIMNLLYDKFISGMAAICRPNISAFLSLPLIAGHLCFDYSQST